MLFQLLITLAFGALGLLLAVPMLGILIVLVREIYSYDLLRLRHVAVELQADAYGSLSLYEGQAAVMIPEPELPANPIPMLAQATPDPSNNPQLDE